MDGDNEESGTLGGDGRGPYGLLKELERGCALPWCTEESEDSGWVCDLECESICGECLHTGTREGEALKGSRVGLLGVSGFLCWGIISRSCQYLLLEAYISLSDFHFLCS
jgi:hypothetical protein